MSDDSTVAPLAYLVLDESGEPIHCASWPEACHEHINDAINEYALVEAAKWRVIAVAEVPYVRG